MEDQEEKEPLEATAESGRAMVESLITEIANYALEIVAVDVFKMRG